MSEKTKDVATQKRKEPGFLDRTAYQLDVWVNRFVFIVKLSAYIALIVIPFYFGWTWNQDLERDALEGILMSPLEYKKDLFEIPYSGYKVQLVRLNGKEHTLADIVYRKKMSEEQLKAHGESLEWEKKAILEKQEKYDEIQNQKRIQKGRQLVKDTGELLELHPDDRQSLNDTILSAIGEK
ncbi:hypothetical protein CMI41_01940 [Candidatus Pacearchaeota archaeon]|nr:hypothetical protein [Candidatus Pacearchaeota archaeon]